jgi:alcohol dehydrogenase class IV
MYATVAPRHTLIGGGAVKDAANLLKKLGLSHPFVVTDPVMMSTGLIERLLTPLREASVPFTVFSDTIPEPEDHIIDKGVRALKAAPGCDCIIAFGGGSPMDTAKAITILAAGGTHIREYKVPASADRAGLPMIAIPTTAGTGSEATRATVITDTSAQEKMLIMGLACVPVAAIVDFELSLTAPQRITADSGLDALTHALEAYVSRRANPYSDAMALAALDLIGPALPVVYHDGQNRAARESMMAAAHFAGIAFTNASVALVHGMSRPVGAHFHVPHGLSNAMLLTAITEFSIPASVARYATASRHLGFAASNASDDAACADLVAGLTRLTGELKVPGPAAFGIASDAWHGLIPLMAEQALGSGSPANNPRVPSVEEMAVLYKKVYATA